MGTGVGEGRPTRGGQRSATDLHEHPVEVDAGPSLDLPAERPPGVEARAFSGPWTLNGTAPAVDRLTEPVTQGSPGGSSSRRGRR